MNSLPHLDSHQTIHQKRLGASRYQHQTQNGPPRHLNNGIVLGVATAKSPQLHYFLSTMPEISPRHHYSVDSTSSSPCSDHLVTRIQDKQNKKKTIASTTTKPTSVNSTSTAAQFALAYSQTTSASLEAQLGHNSTSLPLRLGCDPPRSQCHKSTFLPRLRSTSVTITQVDLSTSAAFGLSSVGIITWAQEDVVIQIKSRFLQSPRSEYGRNIDLILAIILNAVPSYLILSSWGLTVGVGFHPCKIKATKWLSMETA
ncbi:unnamed protein product [Arabis nemorensis]|uniref:Uncharacterized protein n=1 Tax=Arabis nemorensis TaxID=586526 RepID=A0A565CAK5_9BRAS|nr:unnamed protein product [Arabis nemorensis]